MATLEYCLKKLGLSKAEAKRLQKSSKDYVGEGMVKGEADILAVEDFVKLLDKDRAEILTQAKEAGFIPPEKAGVLEYEVGELKEVTEKVEAEIFKPKRECKAGECYKNAAFVAMELEEELGYGTMKVVHGKLDSLEHGRIDHAWIESKDIVYDPTTGVKGPRKWFYDTTNAKAEYELPAEKAATSAVKIGHWGPYTKAELAKVTKLKPLEAVEAPEAPKEPELLPEDHPQVQALSKLVEKQQKLLAGQKEAGISGMDLNETVLDLANMKRALKLFREGKHERDVFQDLMKNYPEIAEIFKEEPPADEVPKDATILQEAEETHTASELQGMVNRLRGVIKRSRVERDADGKLVGMNKKARENLKKLEDLEARLERAKKAEAKGKPVTQAGRIVTHSDISKVKPQGAADTGERVQLANGEIWEYKGIGAYPIDNKERVKGWLKVGKTKPSPYYKPAKEPFSRTKTDMPFYDEMLNNPDYYRTEKKLVGEVVDMRPDEYLKEQAKVKGVDVAESIAVADRKVVNDLVLKIKSGVQLHLPSLDYAKGQQEGKHRALAAKELGLETIPVLVVRSAEAAEKPEAPPAVTEDIIDKFARELEKSGVAYHGEFHYKIVGHPTKEGVFHVERSIAGDRETIVGMRGEEFVGLAQARAWAVQDFRERASQALEKPEKVVTEAEVEIPPLKRERKTFAPGTKEREKLIDQAYDKVDKELEAINKRIEGKLSELSRTRRNAYKKRGKLQEEIRELKRQRQPIRDRWEEARKKRYVALLEDALEKPRDEAQRLAIEHKLLEKDKALTADLSQQYRRAIQQIALNEAKRQEIRAEDQQGVAMEYANDLIAQPIVDTYELQPHVELIAKRREYHRWLPEAQAKIEALELPTGWGEKTANTFLERLKRLSIWDKDSVPPIIKEAKEASREYAKKKRAEEKHAEKVKEAEARLNDEITIEASTMKGMQDQLNKVLDERIKIRQEHEKAIEGTEEADLPPGWVKIKVGPTTFNVVDHSGTLTQFRKRTGRLTGKIFSQGDLTTTGQPTSYKAPPKSPKIPLQNLTRTKLDYIPVKDKPKGSQDLWTNGHFADTGKPPKGTKKAVDKAGGPRPAVTYKDVLEHVEKARKLVHAENQVIGDFEFALDESGKPDFGILTNKQGQKVEVEARYFAHFRVKYPQAKFYFELGPKDPGGPIAVVDRDEVVGVLMSRFVGEKEIPEIGEQVERGKVPIEVDVKKNYGGPSGRGYGSMGEYATAGEYAAPLRSVMGLPEIVQMAKGLMAGQYPIVKKRLASPRYAGVFYPAGLTGRIELRADIFTDPAQAAAVLAHEVGHLVDWLSAEGKTMKRGNILGRIASLKNYMKHTLPRAPGAAEELTEQDRRRLRYQAEKFIKEQFSDKWIDEVIREELPIDPEDVLLIWNSVEQARLINPELYNFVAGLSTAEKKAIVKEALKGATHVSLAQFAKVVERPTGKKIKVDIYDYVEDPETGEIKKRIKEEYRQKIAEKYADLINEEIKKLRLFHRDEVMNELKALTRAWKPFDPAADPKYTKYRYSSVELYADAISALFNAPGLLKSMAPNYYEGFFNYLDRKPEVKQIYDEIQDIIQSNMADDVIIEELYKNQRKGDDAYAMSLDKARKDPFWEAFLRDYFDAHYSLHKVMRHMGERQILPGENPRYKMEDLVYTGSEIEWMLTEVKAKIIQTLEKAGLRWDDFGVVRQLRRVVGEAESPKAAPEGLTPERAKKMLDTLRANRDPEQNRAMRIANREFEKLGEYIIDKAEESGYLDPELIEVMRDNIKYYSTNDVIEYIEKRFGRPVAAKIFPRVGSLKPIANPATATIQKYIAIIKAINRQRAAKSVVQYLRDVQSGKYGEIPAEIKHTAVIQPAKRVWNGRFRELRDPEPGSNLKLLAWLEGGKAQGVYVHKWIADMFEHNPYESMLLAKILRAFANPMRMIFTEANPGFQLFNLARDYQDTAKKMPGAKLSTFWLRYINAIKPAYRSVFGIPDDVMAEMQKGKSIISVVNYRGMDPADREIERMLARYKLEQMKYQNKIVKPFVDLYVWLSNIGRVIERMPKVAGYKYLKEKFPDIDEATLMHMVRVRSGSPAFLRKGRAAPIYNNLLLYSNAAKEGPRANLEALLENPYEYTWKQAKYTIIPKLVMMAGALGFLGGVKAIYDRVSDFDLTNYYVIPIGITPQGRAVTLRIPMDEMSRLVGGIMWKIFRHDEPKYWANIADYMAGQAPTLTPTVDAIFDSALYAMGKNPYDAFRGKYALPEQLFKARDIRTHKAFAKYIANQMGASIIYRFKTDDLDRVKTELEEVLQYPILSNIVGRFLKVSDAGERQAYRKEIDFYAMHDAREILDAKEVIVKMFNDEPITHNDMMKLAKRPMLLEHNVLVQMARKQGGMVFLEKMLGATTKAQAAILKVWFDNYRLAHPGEDIVSVFGVPEIVIQPGKEKKKEKEGKAPVTRSLEDYRRDLRRERGRGNQMGSGPMLGQ